MPCLAYESSKQKVSHQHSEVCLRCPTYHIGNKALVSRSIQNGEMLSLRLKVRSAHFHCFPLLPF
jgi:hypothetical protein